MNEQIAKALGNLTYETAISRNATSHMTKGQRDALKHLVHAAITTGDLKLEINHNNDDELTEWEDDGWRRIYYRVSDGNS